MKVILELHNVTAKHCCKKTYGSPTSATHCQFYRKGAEEEGEEDWCLLFTDDFSLDVNGRPLRLAKCLALVEIPTAKNTVPRSELVKEQRKVAKALTKLRHVVADLEDMKPMWRQHDFQE